jgi:hypothetical protein
MITRRRFLGRFLERSALAPAALAPAALAYRPLLPSAAAQAPLRLAIIGSTYHYGSDLQTIADRFLVGYPHEGDWHMPNVQVVSMYVEAGPHSAQRAASAQGRRQPTVAQSAAPPTPGAGRGAPAEPEHDSGRTADLSAARSQEFGFRLCANIPEALRCGGDRLAVDAVLAVVEQGNYPRNHKG